VTAQSKSVKWSCSSRLGFPAVSLKTRVFGRKILLTPPGSYRAVDFNFELIGIIGGLLNSFFPQLSLRLKCFGNFGFVIEILQQPPQQVIADIVEKAPGPCSISASFTLPLTLVDNPLDNQHHDENLQR